MKQVFGHCPLALEGCAPSTLLRCLVEDMYVPCQIILIWTCPLTNDVEQLLMRLLAIRVSLIKWRLKYFAHFLTRLSYWVERVLYFGYKLLIRYVVCQYSSLWLFIPLFISFEALKFLILVKSLLLKKKNCNELCFCCHI